MAACNRVNLFRPFVSALMRSSVSRNLSGTHRVAILSNTKISSQNLPVYADVNCRAAFHTSVSRCSEHIINIQDEDDFTAKVLKSKTPVLIDFHATWCGPCKLLGPRLEALIAAKEGKIIMAKVDIDDHSELAIKHGVEAVPTVVGMKNGKQVDKFVGLKDDSQLKSFIDKLIGA